MVGLSRHIYLLASPSVVKISNSYPLPVCEIALSNLQITHQVALVQ